MRSVERISRAERKKSVVRIAARPYERKVIDDDLYSLDWPFQDFSRRSNLKPET